MSRDEEKIFHLVKNFFTEYGPYLFMSKAQLAQYHIGSAIYLAMISVTLSERNIDIIRRLFEDSEIKISNHITRLGNLYYKMIHSDANIDREEENEILKDYLKEKLPECEFTPEVFRRWKQRANEKLEEFMDEQHTER